MKELNELYNALRRQREERRRYRAIRDLNLDPHIARDIGIVQDHVNRRAHQMF